jgi:hypothetical protein
MNRHVPRTQLAEPFTGLDRRQRRALLKGGVAVPVTIERDTARHHWLMSTMGARREPVARVHVAGREYRIVHNTDAMLMRNAEIDAERLGESGDVGVYQ